MTTSWRWRTTRFATTGLLVFLLHVVATHLSVAAIYEVPPGDTAALIAAINAANADAAADVINLRGGVYLLTLADNDGVAGPNALPVITTLITVNGRGSTIVGSGMFRFFHVAESGSLLLTRATLRGGNTDHGGGAIRNEGALAITNSTFRGNQGGEGGAILNNGTAVVWQSTFVANAAGGDDSGGAVRNNGSMSILNSTFSANRAVDDGGAIHSDGPLTVTNCTFVGNRAGFGGGAIQGSNAGESSTIKNLIVASNTPQNCLGVTVAQGDNLDTDGTCDGLVVTLEQLRLGPLARHGGATATHPLLRGSVALDAVQDCTTADGLPVSIDQRGVRRPQRAACDVGAYEASRDAIRD